MHQRQARRCFEATGDGKQEYDYALDQINTLDCGQVEQAEKRRHQRASCVMHDLNFSLSSM